MASQRIVVSETPVDLITAAKEPTGNLMRRHAYSIQVVNGSSDVWYAESTTSPDTVNPDGGRHRMLLYQVYRIVPPTTDGLWCWSERGPAELTITPVTTVL